MKSFFSAAAVAILLSAAPVSAQDGWNETYFGLLGSGMVETDEMHSPLWDSGVGIDLRYGQHSGNWLGYELRGFYSTVSLLDTSAKDGNRSGLGADLVLRFPEMLTITPYVLGGLGAVYADKLPGPDELGMYVNAGAGVLTQPLVTLFDVPLRLRAEYRAAFEDYHADDYLDHHVFFGIEAAFMEAKELPPPPPEPIQVVEPEPEPVVVAPVVKKPAPTGPKDSDGDGVFDAGDRCPDTPAGKRVDADGCQMLKVLTLTGVNFELNSATLRQDSLAVLDEAVTALTTEYGKTRVEVAGHTDGTGAASYNLGLSQRRAESVLNYLVSQGVEPGRLTATGYGEIEPVASNDTRDGREQNRRVELRIKEGGNDAAAPKRHSLNPNG